MMKKRYSRMLAILLTLSMVLCLLAGCGSSSSSTSTSSTSSSSTTSETSTTEETTQTTAEAATDTAATTETATESEVATETATTETVSAADATSALDMNYSVNLPIVEDTITVTMWTGVAPYAASAISSVDDMENYAVLAERTGIQFDLTIVNGLEQSTSFALMIAAGDYCDVINGMSYYATGITGALHDEVIVDLYDYVVEYAPHYWEFVSASSECLATLITDDGQMGTIATTYQEVGLENIGIGIRGDWLEEFGMDLPETYDELYEYGMACLTTYGASFAMYTSGNTPMFSMGLGTIAGEFMTYDDVVQYYIEYDGYYEYLKLMSQWYAEGLLYQDFYCLPDGTGNGDLFANGTICLNQVGASVMNALYEKVDTDYSAKFVGILCPVVNKGDSLPCSLEVALISSSDTWAVTSACDSEKIPYLMQLVDYLYSDEGALLFNYGTEGYSFTYQEDGQPRYTDMIISPEDGTSPQVAKYYYVTLSAPSRNDMRKNFYSFDDTAWEALDMFAEQYDGSNCYPAAAEAGLTTEEAERYAAAANDVETYVDAEVLKFITGATEVNEENYANFVATARSMGLDTMDEIYQAAYDRYLEKVK